MHDLPQEVHPWVRAFASYAHSRRGTIQVQVLPQVIRQVGPLPDSYIRSDLFSRPLPRGKERVEHFGNKTTRESYASFERHVSIYRQTTLSNKAILISNFFVISSKMITVSAISIAATFQ